MSAASGPSVSDEEITLFIAAIDRFAQALGPDASLLQPEQAKRLPKARKQAASIVPTIADLSARYGVSSQAYPLAAVTAKQNLVKTLIPVGERIGAVQKLVADMSLVAQSGAWEGAMVNYGLLKTEARGNAALRKALQPVRNSMRAKYQTEDGTTTVFRGKAAPKPTKSSPAKVAPDVTVDSGPPTGAPPSTATSNPPALAGSGAAKT